MTSQTVIALVYLFTFGQTPIENLHLSNPQSLHVDVNQMLYLADTGNNRIISFKQDGTPVKIVGGYGWDKEQFDSPIDICARSGLDVFVVDHNNHRIERYDKDLNYISSFYSDDSKPTHLQFGYPRAVSISRHGEIVLIDGENIRLLKINSFGEPELSFGDFAEGRGKLDNPIQVEISNRDRIYVTDSADGRIVVFDYFGNYLTEIGHEVLVKPAGLYVDAFDYMWVVDAVRKQVLTFDPKGAIVLQSGTIMPGKPFEDPRDVVALNDRVYVLDANVVHAFKLTRNVIE